MSEIISSTPSETLNTMKGVLIFFKPGYTTSEALDIASTLVRFLGQVFLFSGLRSKQIKKKETVVELTNKGSLTMRLQ